MMQIKNGKKGKRKEHFRANEIDTIIFETNRIVHGTHINKIEPNDTEK